MAEALHRDTQNHGSSLTNRLRVDLPPKAMSWHGESKPLGLARFFLKLGGGDPGAWQPDSPGGPIAPALVCGAEGREEPSPP